ncbi:MULTISPECIES: hypothetical protein [unclassified Paraburkholderia]|uniref:hypothetical protein n=1 Tax=unclassified Paraburkholderia TaxID=2615204 RepID=UPI002AB1D460|nr:MULTISPECIES: hypothetical protein [unclassified Paraburkholderia]
MKLGEWLVRAAIKLVAMAAVVIAYLSAALMGLDELIPKLMARHYVMAGMYGVGVLSAFVGTLPLGLAIERHALKALRWPAWNPEKK